MTFRMTAENNCKIYHKYMLSIRVSLSISYLQLFLIHLSWFQVNFIFLLTFTNKLILLFLSHDSHTHSLQIEFHVQIINRF